MMKQQVSLDGECVHEELTFCNNLALGPPCYICTKCGKHGIEMNNKRRIKSDWY
jgi:hypothetical protein